MFHILVLKKQIQIIIVLIVIQQLRSVDKLLIIEKFKISEFYSNNFD